MINEDVKEVEKVLYKYSEISTKINFINKEIEILKNEYEGCKGIIYNEKESATNKFNSSVENEVIYRERELLRLNRELNRANRFKHIMGLCINNLYGVDKRVIELRYLTKEKLTWKHIANRVNYSEDYCRKNIRARAINKIINYLKNTTLDIYKYI